MIDAEVRQSDEGWYVVDVKGERGGMFESKVEAVVDYIKRMTRVKEVESA